MRSAADMDEVGWPEPAAVVQRMLSTRSWAASSFQVAIGSAMGASLVCRCSVNMFPPQGDGSFRV